MKFLLSKGANVNALNIKKETPFRVACKWKNLQAIKLFKDYFSQT